MHSLLHNYTVIDFSNLTDRTEQLYVKEVYGNLQLSEEELTATDKRNLMLYCTYKSIIDSYTPRRQWRKCVFYIDTTNITNTAVYRSFIRLSKIFPIVYYEDNKNLIGGQLIDGELEELKISIRNVRSTFDFTKFKKRKMGTFYEKFKIKIKFPD